MTTQPITNPLIPEAGMSDPHMLVENDVCYLFTGWDVGYDQPTWVMPEWRIYRSTDLAQWQQVGTISPADNYMGAGNTHCWAGDVVARNGRYHWFFPTVAKKLGSWWPTASKGPTAMPLMGP